VGFPIPELVGEESKEIHWQPMTFPNESATKQKQPGKKAHFKTFDFQKQFAKDAKLPWGISENCSQARFSSRGSFPSELCRAKVALLGCGALGSHVAESLVRGGVRNIALYDTDVLQHGNLSRHTLTASDLYLGKATSLARFLSSIALLGDIRGYEKSIPLDLESGGEAVEGLLDADLIIDCTADDAASEWLSYYASENNTSMVSLFVNAEASFLTVYGSGEACSSQAVYEEAMSRIGNNETPVPRDEYYEQGGLMIQDIGCWHPTFPARDNHIESLASAALDIISHEVQKAHNKGWLAVIHRLEGNVEMAVSPHPLTELMWKREYA
jgi:molybdopterin/thiamine biosynthesis adenylyltransferase